MTPSLSIEATVETWPIAGAFAIARGAKREAIVVVAQVSDGTHRRAAANACPTRATARPSRACAPPSTASREVTATAPRCSTRCRPGAARNALDCALWDYEAKRAGMTRRATWPACRACARSPPPTRISLDSRRGDGRQGGRAAARDLPLLKLKLGGDGRCRAHAPGARRLPDTRA